MEYPGSHLTKPWRRALLITCLVLFFVLCPVIVMLAAGYRYDWHNGLLRETGSISVDIKPADAKIFLNDVEIKENLPIRLNNITPRKYTIRITAAGYYDWQKEIEVKNKQTSYIKEISLLKKEEPKKISNHLGTNLSLSSDGRYLAYYYENSIWVYDRNTQTEQIIYKLTNGSSPRITWSKKQYFLAIQKNTNTINVINIENQQNWLVNSPDKKGIQKYEWQNTIEPELVFSTQNKIYVARPTTQKIIEMTENKYVDWVVEDGALWTLQTDPITKQIKIIKDTLGFATDITNGAAQPTNLLSINDWRLEAAGSNVAILKKTNSNETMIVNNKKNYPINGDKIILSKYSNWWLIWTPWELVSFSDNSEPVLLNRSGEQLQQVWPMDEYNTLALVWSDKTTVLFPYYDVGHNLINQKIINSVIDNNNKIFYFIAEEKTGIWQLKY